VILIIGEEDKIMDKTGCRCKLFHTTMWRCQQRNLLGPALDFKLPPFCI